MISLELPPGDQASFNGLVSPACQRQRSEAAPVCYIDARKEESEGELDFLRGNGVDMAGTLSPVLKMMLAVVNLGELEYFSRLPGPPP